MTVAQLIAELLKLDPNMRVAVAGEMENDGLAVEATGVVVLEYVDREGLDKEQAYIGVM